MTDKKPTADDLTVPELKAGLDKAGVDYPSDARREELVELAEKAGVVQKQSGEPTAESTSDEPEQPPTLDPGVPFTDFTAASQVGQFQEGQSVLGAMAGAPAAAVEAERVVTEAMAAASGTPLTDEEVEERQKAAQAEADKSERARKADDADRAKQAADIAVERAEAARDDADRTASSARADAADDTKSTKK